MMHVPILKQPIYCNPKNANMTANKIDNPVINLFDDSVDEKLQLEIKIIYIFSDDVHIKLITYLSVVQQYSFVVSPSLKEF